jgi:hypothetical protein
MMGVATIIAFLWVLPSLTDGMPQQRGSVPRTAPAPALWCHIAASLKTPPPAVVNRRRAVGVLAGILPRTPVSGALRHAHW